jgi:uncharacterized OsmC-like protein
MALNNIDLKQVEEFLDEIKKDPGEAFFMAKMEGIWCFDEDGPQFTAEAKTRDGPVTLSLSHPNFSGPGRYPSPMSFGLFWLAGCASSTFMQSAATKGIPITSLRTRIEADLNYRPQFSLSDEPLISEYRLFMEVSSPTPEEKVRELLDDVMRGCMGMYTVRNAIRLVPDLRIKK